jgi:hypothetical protein
VEFIGIGTAGLDGMEVKPTDLKGHTANIAKLLDDICDSSSAESLVQVRDLIISTSNSAQFSRRVTTDLGGSEFALRLPIPDAQQARYWIGLHERWEGQTKRKIRFRDCGLRLYVGGKDEEAVQFLRLEWVAPTPDPDGEPIYQGKHAGHPHWHIDRSALVGPEDYLRSLDALTAPAPGLQSELEVFSEATSDLIPAQTRLVHDCSWLQKMHLPAQAQWMRSEWNGSAVPGPHQSEPSSLAELERWWAGALRYLVAELPH